MKAVRYTNPLYIKWMEEITMEIEETLECSTSDTQGIMEATSLHFPTEFISGTESIPIAHKIIKLTEIIE